MSDEPPAPGNRPPEVAVEIRIVSAADAAFFDDVEDGVFDGPIIAARLREFLQDPRHHLAVALHEGRVVGMAGALHYVHPDKEPELWVNEVGVAPSVRRMGLGRRLLEALLQHGRALGCAEAWVLTEEDNLPARGLYEDQGGIMPNDSAILYSFPLHGDSSGETEAG